MATSIRHLVEGEEAATAVEYAVLLAMIIAVVIVAIGGVGSQAGGYWGNIRDQIATFGVGG